MSIRHGEVVSEPGEIVEVESGVRRRLEFPDPDEEAEIEKCISCRIPNPYVLGTESGNTFTYHAAASGDRMLPYCPLCEANHEIIVQNNRRAALAWEYDSDDSLELTGEEDLPEDYEGEYENEDLPENNTEKATDIKDAVKEVGEKMFDVQDQLKEGDYLELMNLLQKVTNKVNSL